jgi:imidazolonepropionase-like amidohydrolase
MTETSIKGQTNMERIGMVRIADGPDEVRLAIREELRKGASFIKIMIGGGLSSRYDPLDVTTMSKEEIAAAVDEVTRWGTYVTAHAYTDVSLNLGMDAGMTTFEHMHLASRETFERIASLGAVVSSQVGVVPTLCDNPLFVDPASKKKACNLQEKGIASFGYINDLNIRTGFGVDSFGSLEGYRYNSQAMVVRKDFFSNDKILEQMFANNAELIAMTGERNPYKDGPLAVIAPGAYADIILVEGDPTKDVAVFSNWETGIDLVMKDGVIYRNELEN